MCEIYLARLLYPVRSLGPGNRLGIWVCGCHRQCPFCANPELQAFEPNRIISVEDAALAIRTFLQSQAVDGLTITGGEPFEQADALEAVFAQLEGMLPEDILIFTGYTIEALQERSDSGINALLRRAAVVIDGEYREELNTGSVLRGSDNQRILFLNPDIVNKYAQYIESGTRLYENVATSEGVFCIGLHKPGFRQLLDEQKRKRGLN